MRHLTLRFIIALLTFIIGMIAASLWFVFYRPSPVEVKFEVNAPSPLHAEPERTYKRGIAGEGAASAPGASFITLESSDGMMFTKRNLTTCSSGRASTNALYLSGSCAPLSMDVRSLRHLFNLNKLRCRSRNYNPSTFLQRSESN